MIAYWIVYWALGRQRHPVKGLWEENVVGSSPGTQGRQSLSRLFPVVLRYVPCGQEVGVVEFSGQ